MPGSSSTKARNLLFALIVLALVPGYLWFTLLSPFGYQLPADHHIDPQAQHQVFAYGTLTRPWVRRLVIGRNAQSDDDLLLGYRKNGLDLRVEQSARTSGQRFAVSAAELARLDRYERLGVRYQRSLKTLASGETAWVYQRLEQ